MLTYESIKNHFADLVARGENAKSTATNYTNTIQSARIPNNQISIARDAEKSVTEIFNESQSPSETLKLHHQASQRTQE